MVGFECYLATVPYVNPLLRWPRIQESQRTRFSVSYQFLSEAEAEGPRLRDGPYAVRGHASKVFENLTATLQSDAREKAQTL
jgi:hypothetical protein